MITVTAKNKYSDILTKDALDFLEALVAFFGPLRNEMLSAREDDAIHRRVYGTNLDYSFMTVDIRSAEWKVAKIPDDLKDRRVEITGPTDRKMVINALNSGARAFMADFEDSLSPTWDNLMEGQRNLRDAIRRDITYEHPTKGTYRLNKNPAVLMVRPRGLHLDEYNIVFGSESIPASLVDFGLYFFHNAQELINRGTGPYFYLPKLESAVEAAWWNNVFNFAQNYIGIPIGTIKATVLIETLPAAYQMEEILYALRDHSAGLNCGRWDYIFSYIKTIGHDSRYILPDRSLITMEAPFMNAYVRKLIDTCHRRGTHAMGGMAAQIPIRNNNAANAEAMEAVRSDKLREVKMGHDGTWVAHPGLILIAQEVFDAHMPQENQIESLPKFNTKVSGADLREPPSSVRRCTLSGLVKNIDVSLRYIESWLQGAGCVPLYNMMEDAATAEISRAQIWQWVYHGVKLASGEIVTMHLVNEHISQIVKNIKEETLDMRFSKIDDAADILRSTTLMNELTPFLTLDAYDILEDRFDTLQTE